MRHAVVTRDSPNMETGMKQTANAGFLLGLVFDSEGGGDLFLKHQCTSTGLHAVMFQKKTPL
jgi:hypothetical protein